MLRLNMAAQRNTWAALVTINYNAVICCSGHSAVALFNAHACCYEEFKILQLALVLLKVRI